MSFQVVAMVTALAGLLLGLGWLFAGHKLLQRWGMAANAEALVVGRRLGAVYLAVSLILFMASHAAPSDLRFALCTGLLFAMLLLALLGGLEYKAGRANKLIFISVVLELGLALGFASVLLQG